MAEQEDTVLVNPLSSYQEGDGLKHSHDKPYPVSRARAAALKANGLVELVEHQPAGAEAPKPRGRRARAP
ncbi:hypothetical protein ACQKJ1_01130 [Methylorubrum rhodesianum]|uniref:hypothetical protein n=1 Tax=Methylorubrum rhodesianum TaxID=29427 RepID=UPI003D08B36E